MHGCAAGPPGGARLLCESESGRPAWLSPHPRDAARPGDAAALQAGSPYMAAEWRADRQADDMPVLG